MRLSHVLLRNDPTRRLTERRALLRRKRQQTAPPRGAIARHRQLARHRRRRRRPTAGKKKRPERRCQGRCWNSACAADSAPTLARRVPRPAAVSSVTRRAKRAAVRPDDAGLSVETVLASQRQAARASRCSMDETSTPAGYSAVRHVSREPHPRKVAPRRRGPGWNSRNGTNTHATGFGRAKGSTADSDVRDDRPVCLRRR